MLEFCTVINRSRIVFMGTPDFAVPPLLELAHQQYDIVAVYTQPDRPAGRGRSPAPSPVKSAALKLNLPVMQSASFKEPGAIDQLAALRPDVIVVAAYGLILPQAVLDIPEYGCINIHPSLLPKYRGPSPVTSAILAGDEVTGVTFMLLDAGMDTGAILAQEQITISSQDTTGSLTAQLSEIAARLLPDVLERWMAGGIKPQPQNDAEATYSKLIRKEDGEIDWHLPAIELWHRIRAFQPWPGCHTFWQGKRLVIAEAAPLPPVSGVAVGQVVALSQVDAAIGVGTGEGVLAVVKVQLEGKRAMTSTEFIRGYRQFIGAILPS